MCGERGFTHATGRKRIPPAGIQGHKKGRKVYWATVGNRRPNVVSLVIDNMKSWPDSAHYGPTKYPQLLDRILWVSLCGDLGRFITSNPPQLFFQTSLNGTCTDRRFHLVHPLEQPIDVHHWSGRFH